MTATPDTLYSDQPPAAARILRSAHALFFSHGYSAFTMDELAHELAMSKKTLYVHFPSKDAIIDRIIEVLVDRMRAGFEPILADSSLTLTQRITGIVGVAARHLGTVTPALLRDLQRNAPATYQKIEEARQRLVPVVFGRLIRAGIAEGKIRSDIDPAFATEFWFQAIRGMVQPAILDRTHLTLPQTIERGLDLFFAGLLTPAGRRDYEKHG